ncbi:MAG: Hercynine oxygenase [Anaerolineae bacterium]|nr:Hercynine oxygenase [Anaerolineae bacterium]
MPDDLTAIQTELEEVNQTIAGLRKHLVGPALETALQPLLAKQMELQTRLVAGGGQLQSAGERGVVAGRAGANIITGDGNSVTTIIKLYRQGQPAANPAALRRQIAGYLRWVVERFSAIELRGIKRDGQQVVQLNLDTVYVPLAARAYHGSRPQQISLDQVLKQGQHVVVTGGPGCGKTTVLLHLAYTLSLAIGADQPDLAYQKLGLTGSPPMPPPGHADWKAYFKQATPQQRTEELRRRGDFKSWRAYFDQFISLPLPILVPLSSYALYLRQLPPGAASEQKTLAAFITHHLIQNQASFELPPDFFIQLLRVGQHVILLLDGLDEVPTEDERTVVRQHIEQLVNGRDGLRVVVTCRSAAYKGRTLLGKDFKPVEVLPLGKTDIEHLVRQAYADIYRIEPQTARQKERELLAAIDGLEAQRRRMYGYKTEPLITSPLLVRMLLVVHYSERRLPDQRAELYMRATDAMLLPEYAWDEAVANRIGRQVGDSQSIHRELVQHLAFKMHSLGPNQGREIDEDDLRRFLQEHPQYGHLTASFIELTKHRGTLLEERLGQYRFLHLAFQEYLTARYLAETLRSDGGLDAIAEFLEAGPLRDSWWREPALLVVGYLSIGTPAVAQKLLRRLAGLDDEAAARQPTAETCLAAAELAGSAALEWPGIPDSLQDELAGQLARLFQTPKLLGQTPPLLRASAGNTLARLGDPRPGVLDVDGTEFCYVSPGPFMMGEDNSLHENPHLNYGYWLARFPVTVAHFRQFIEDSGYRPKDTSSLRGFLNHPVTDVTWYDAIEFGHWLTDHWRSAGLLPVGWRVTLPSEAEWEKAARGGLQVPAREIIRPIGKINLAGPKILVDLTDNNNSARRYPWGNEIEPALANYQNTRLDDTSTIGCFPQGKSCYGCEEMSGNMWEWTRSITKDYPYDPADGREDSSAGTDVLRIRRGGSFGNDAQRVRCAVRSRNFPDLRRRLYGFRVVVSPIIEH